MNYAKLSKVANRYIDTGYSTTSAIVGLLLSSEDKNTVVDACGNRAMSLIYGAIILTNDLEAVAKAQTQTSLQFQISAPEVRGSSTAGDIAMIKKLEEILMLADHSLTQYRFNADVLYAAQGVWDNEWLPMLNSNYKEVFANTFTYTNLHNVETSIKLKVGIAHIPTSVDVSKQASQRCWKIAFFIYFTKPFLLCLDVYAGFC